MFSEHRRPYLEGLRSAPSLCRILPKVQIQNLGVSGFMVFSYMRAGRLPSRHKVSQAEWRQIALPSRNVYRMCGPQRAGVAVRHGSAFPQWSQTNLCTRLTSSTSRPGRRHRYDSMTAGRVYGASGGSSSYKRNLRRTAGVSVTSEISWCACSVSTWHAVPISA